MTPDVSILIVNWNSRDLLRRCIDSVRTAASAPSAARYELIVVDNASVDSSIERAGLGPGDRLVRNAENRGFGAACNQGAALASGRYLLLLNPDCELHAGAIETCLAAMADSAARIGVCGVRLLDNNGQTWRMCQRRPDLYTLLAKPLGLHVLTPQRQDHFLKDFDHLSDRDVDNVIGAFYLIEAALYRRLGGFDERFFVYWEDVDLSIRVQQAGLRVRYLATPTSYHRGGGVSEQVKAARLFYATRSRIQYAFKHLSPAQAWIHALVTLAIEPLSRTLHALLRRDLPAIGETWRGFAMLYRALPQMWAGRAA
jgi:hypothetical protein